MTEQINWDVFKSPWFKVTETPTDITISGWEMVEKEYQGELKKGLQMRVLTENKEEVNKQWVVFSKRAAQALQPFIQAAEKEGKKTVQVRIYKTGSAMNTQFHVKGI